ncbi:MAG: DMT family transporter [Deltaproteobacteria bacterium]|jgi:drug/metabolite transporter (DMT)-like permease|nr:DMT family transporter [Deltaproteobacteria bacterium]
MALLSRYQKGALYTLAAAFFFAGKTILVKLAYQGGIDPVSLLALRMIVAGSIFLCVLCANVLRGRWSLKLSGRQWLLVAVMGLFGYYLSSLLDFQGLSHIDATLGRMILFLYPTMVVIIHAFIVRTMLPLRVILALGVSYLGLILMMSPEVGHGADEGFWKGCGFVFLSALVYSFYLTGVDRYFSEVRMGLFISVTMCFSCLAVFIHFLLLFPPSALFGFSRGVYVYALILGSVSTVLPIYAMSLGIALIGASKAALYNMLGPVMTLAMGVILLGEELEFIEIVGAFLIILGVARARTGGKGRG